ncbi:transcriptional repressor ctcf-like [Lentinula edodes]|uniref:Transcriptional repressor ctcf-like n=1 Tax=Lentinula edodes TaxID=5353 RepID=A0A1Q3ENX7_LENED|nr:transcriptional repressor ctcf-like [Lentinula edodes]
MPRAKSLKDGRPNEANMAATCTICQAIISNRTDLPRHMRIHSADKHKFMHRCPYPDCNFENLQKSNVETHIRTHTKSKTNNCPDCDFTTVDPGSLTRHRKRIHGYIPKSRRSRHPKPTTTISSDDGSSRISSNQNDGGEGSSSMQTTVHEGQDSESYSGPYDTGHVQSSHQSQSLLLDESISRPNFNQAPISRFITTLSSSTSTSAPIPMTTKRISRARMEEVEAAEAAEKARAIEILSGLRHSIEEGNFDTGDADALCVNLRVGMGSREKTVIQVQFQHRVLDHNSF